MVDETTRQAYEIALRGALRDQARANATVEFLREKLGMADNVTVVLGPGDLDASDDTPRDVGPVSVTDAEFYGMSQTRAAAAFLERAGRSRPQRTEAIIDALRKGGIRFDGKDPAATFYAILARTPTFHRVGKSTWGLSAWYPGVARKAAKAGAGAPTLPDDGSSMPPPDGETERKEEPEPEQT
jgi:hypothetical protein